MRIDLRYEPRLNRPGFRALAPAVVQVDELPGAGVVADDVEPADQFFFRSGKRRARRCCW